MKYDILVNSHGTFAIAISTGSQFIVVYFPSKSIRWIGLGLKYLTPIACQART